MNMPELLILLKKFEPEIQKTICRVIPSTFNPDDPELCAYPRPHAWRWQSCERALRAFDARGILFRAPLFWQIEIFLHHVCRDVGAYIFPNEIGNMPVGAAALREADLDTVLTSAEDARDFARYLSERPQPLARNWIIIHNVSDSWTIGSHLIASSANIAQEVHLFPGLPLLTQCEHLCRQKDPVFHLSPEFSWDVQETQPHITSRDTNLVPLKNFEAPCRIKIDGTCSCGERIVSQI